MIGCVASWSSFLLFMALCCHLGANMLSALFKASRLAELVRESLHLTTDHMASKSSFSFRCLCCCSPATAVVVVVVVVAWFQFSWVIVTALISKHPHWRRV